MKSQQESLQPVTAIGPEPRTSRAQELAQALLLRLYAPPSVLVDARCACVGFFGDIQPYLEVGANSANANLFDIVHPHLRARLKAALKSQWPFDEELGDGANAEGETRADALN